MIWILLVVAVATHVSCHEYEYSGTITLKKDEFCNLNNIHRRNCEEKFQTFLTTRPDIQKCETNPPIYSNRCSSILYVQTSQPAPCTGNRCNDFSIRHSEAMPTPERLPEPADKDDFELPGSSVPYDARVMDFSVKLFQKAFPGDDSTNYIISPIMVQTLLSYLNDGASSATRQEMDSVLQLNMNDLHDIDRALKPHSEQGHVSKNKLDTASQIFKSTTIELLPAFRQSLKRNQIPLDELDFTNRRFAAESINNWAKEKTRQRILEVIDENSIDSDTKLLLMNALYFNGTWMYKFNKTERGSFELNGRPPKRMSVSMMYLTKDLRNGNTRTDNSANGMTWIELPYDGDRMSMILFLPNERFQLDRELRKFTDAQLQTILYEIAQDEPSKVRVQLPEFKAESTVSLVEPLKKLGIVSMFGDSKPFDRLSNDDVKISDVKQKSFLTVNPHGTVATSVTTATVIPLSITHTLDFKADQPFALIIMDKQKKLPLFFAKISQPLKVTSTKRH
ncbi:leukocyte elastase inhibitor-like [Anopheles marshallii]|uniref:leukocyte elastase inhibitor-like n=1 Tax=Anopheles marshallii TaxID=1521116 RepID=UPI00237AD712|nr:leukocyte elastase inhibitor-like [Anopheles marshallii]